MNYLRRVPPTVLIAIAAIFLVFAVGFYRMKTKSPATDVVTAPTAQSVQGTTIDYSTPHPSDGMPAGCTTSNPTVIEIVGEAAKLSNGQFVPVWHEDLKVGDIVSYTSCQ